MYLVNQRITANYPSRTQHGDGWVLGYAAVALFAIVATIYFAYGGPGMTADQIEIASVWP